MRSNILGYKVLLYLLSFIMIGIGIVFIVESNLGGDGITVFYVGLSKTFNVSTGVSTYIYNITTILLATIFSRKYLGWGTFVFGLGVGFFVSLIEFMVNYMQLSATTLLVQYAFLFGGLLSLAFGLAGIITLRMGLNGLDCLLFHIKDKTNLSYRLLRTIADSFIMIVGVLLGGTIGIGTIISVLTLGSLIQLFLTLFTRKNLFFSNAPSTKETLLAKR